jgi:hypothetical protein
MQRPSEVVDAGGGHYEQRRRARVIGRMPDAMVTLRTGGDVTHRARRIKRIRLRHPHHVEAGFLQFLNFLPASFMPFE